MKKLISLTLALIWLFSPNFTIACKDPILGEKFPITNFEVYDCIVIVKIDKSIHSDLARYDPLISFDATICESIKGGLKIGDKFTGEAKNEEARAACPVHLEEKGIYLLLLSKVKDKYQLSRFSFPVKNNHQYFNNYVTQIKALIRKE